MILYEGEGWGALRANGGWQAVDDGKSSLRLYKTAEDAMQAAKALHDGKMNVYLDTRSIYQWWQSVREEGEQA